jgi:hypothetical protein
LLNELVGLRGSQPDAHVVGIARLQLIAQALVETNHLVATVQRNLKQIRIIPSEILLTITKLKFKQERKVPVPCSSQVFEQVTEVRQQLVCQVAFLDTRPKSINRPLNI